MINSFVSAKLHKSYISAKIFFKKRYPTIVLQHMHVGDKWEIYLPAEMGYGSRSIPGIPRGSTLIFTIRLLGVA